MLSSGTRLGSYEVTGSLGAGGMGEVYRARDTRLGREVALKVLPASVADDPDRIARFEREARTLAGMNHPNIAHLYGLEDAGGVKALAMELVEGPTLADRLGLGVGPPSNTGTPLAAEEALAIARQVIDALAAAHEHGVVHRDLKPANIKVRDDGTVKVLDFGLAKALDAGGGASSAVSQLPTLTTPAMTQAGVILGTAAYMSPEQARGKPVDQRADVWAFGCVLFEMLTGTRAFGDEDLSLTLSNVLRREPAFERLPAALPLGVPQLVRACLRKDPRERLHAIGDARLVLDGAFDAPPAPTVQAVTPARRVWPATAAALIAGVLGAGGAWLARPTPSAPVSRVLRSSITLPAGQDLTFPAFTYRSIALSADGTQLAYVANGQLYLRKLSEELAAPVAGTEGADPRGVVFSPDGQWLLYFSVPTTQLMRVPVTGAPVPVAIGQPLALAWGFRWNADDTILFVTYQGIFEVPSKGGTAVRLVGPADGKNEVFDSPQFLPGGRTLLYAVTDPSSGWGKARIAVQAIGTNERREVWVGGTAPRYLPSGHLLMERGGALLAAAFDSEQLALRGVPAEVVSSVTVTPAAIVVNGSGAQLDVSDSGDLAFFTGAGPVDTRRITLVDRTGREAPSGLPAATYFDPRLSFDGRQLAVAVADRVSGLDVWTYGLNGGPGRRVTDDPSPERYPTWSPDGRALTFFSNRGAGMGTYLRRLAADEAARAVHTSLDRLVAPFSWSADGRRLATTETALVGDTNYDVGLLSLDEPAARTGLLETMSLEAQPAISPDGAWLAYTSNEGGTRAGVMVRPFPDVRARPPVAVGPGAEPVWTRGGRELVYRSGDKLMAVPVELTPTFRASTPVELFRFTYFTELGRQWDVTADGQRFVVLEPEASVSTTAERPRINLVQGWVEELKRLVPTP